MTDPGRGPGPLQSQFADDPEMRDLVELFVAELPGRMRSLQEAAQGQDLAMVKRLAHQLRGSAGGYGFPAIGASAARLEEAAKAAMTTGDSVRTTLEEVRDLIELCRRASGPGAPTPGPRAGAA